MADAFRPLTLLLGALCLWALCLLILALSGLGSRFPAVTNAAQPPPLPTVSLTRSVSRLTAMADYLEVGERPLMNQTRRPVAQSADDGAGSADLDVTLTSVLITPRLQLAILTDNKDGTSRRARVGETLQGSAWRLVQLEPRSAVIEGPSGQRTLELRVFDGRSGQAPTPVATANANDDEPQQPIQAITSPPPPPPPTPMRPQTNGDPAAKPETAEQLTQEQQVEAIRRRIEARRAQMRAEAEAAGAKEK